MSRSRWRRPRLLTCVVFFAMIVLFLFAAHWQWQRAQVKDASARVLAATIAAPAQRALADAIADPQAQDVERLTFDGALDLSRLILLDNRVHDGQFGVEVFAVLNDRNAGPVLASLGWIASDPSRRVAPSIPAIADQIEGEGLFTEAPASGLQLGAGAPAKGAAFPLLLTRIRPVELRSVLDLPTLPERVLQLAPDTESGFIRDWHPGGLTADRHRGYALQWASFAIGALVFFILWHRPRKEVKHD